MNTTEKIYLTASEVAELLGISAGHSYKIIHRLNAELEKEGFLVTVQMDQQKGDF